MKMEFAKEKSEYIRLIIKCIDEKTSNSARLVALHKIKNIEEWVRLQGDDLLIIVTTTKTNPMKGKTAPPMKEPKEKR